MTADRDAIRAALLGAIAENDARAGDGWQRTPHSEARYSTPNPYALRSVAGLAADDWQAIRYEAPTRAATLAADVLVPAAQAAVTGCAVGALAAVLILALQLDVTGWAAVAVGCVAAAVAWLWLLRDARRLLRTSETLTRRDAGELPPSPAADSLRLEVQTDGGRHWLLDELQTTRDKFNTWARAALAGRSLAQGAWTGAGGCFSRGEYDRLVAALVRAGILRYVNPNAHAQGLTLTAAGRATLRRITEEETGHGTTSL